MTQWNLQAVESRLQSFSKKDFYKNSHDAELLTFSKSAGVDFHEHWSTVQVPRTTRLTVTIATSDGLLDKKIPFTIFRWRKF